MNGYLTGDGLAVTLHATMAADFACKSGVVYVLLPGTNKAVLAHLVCWIAPTFIRGLMSFQIICNEEEVRHMGIISPDLADILGMVLPATVILNFAPPIELCRVVFSCSCEDHSVLCF